MQPEDYERWRRDLTQIIIHVANAFKAIEDNGLNSLEDSLGEIESIVASHPIEDPIEQLLQVIDKQITHEQKLMKTDYQRGFVKGLSWAKTEIQKRME